MSTVSIDTVIFAMKGVFLDALPSRLKGYKEVHDEGGAVSVEGWMDHLWVKEDAEGTLVRFSLPRLVFGTNAVPLPPASVHPALTTLAGKLGVKESDVMAAPVYRLDIWADLLLKRSPVDYVRALVEVPGMDRVVLGPASVAFKIKRRELAFYDKHTEVTGKGGTMPPGLEGAHVLRYELRFKKEVADQFHCPVFASDLCDPSFTGRLVGDWERHFATVKSARPVRTDTVTTPKTLRDRFAVHGIEAAGGVGPVVQAINDARAAGMVGRDQASRQRKTVRALVAAVAHTLEPDLMPELRAAVREAAEATRLDLII